MTGEGGSGILSWKTKKAGCIRLTSRPRQRGQQRFSSGLPLWGPCRCADARDAFAFFYLSNGGATVISKVEHELNEEIRDKEIRLIGEDGEQLGIVSSAEGLHIAEEKGLDLVKISPQATPPVCKLMNYGKFKFERSKKEKDCLLYTSPSPRD